MMPNHHSICRQQNRFKRVFHDDSDNVLAKKIVLAKPIALLVHGWLDEFNSIFLRTKDKGLYSYL